MSLNICAPGTHCVYICYDANGEAVYIGRTIDLEARLKAHATTSPWWPLKDTVEWVPCDGAVEARLVEREYIASFKPAGNINDAAAVRTARTALPDSAVDSLRDLYDLSYLKGPTSIENQRFTSYVCALRAAGWSLAAIAAPLGYTREATRNWEARGGTRTDIPPVPSLPLRPAKPLNARQRSAALLTADVVARLTALQQQARLVNGWTPLDSPLRAASVELTELMASLVMDGVMESHMASAMGLSHAAVALRLARHGYKKVYPSQGAGAVYRGIVHDVGRRAECGAGHPLSGDNLRLVNGDARRRACRACARRRSSDYKQRKAQAAS